MAHSERKRGILYDACSFKFTNNYGFKLIWFEIVIKNKFTKVNQI